MYNNILNNKKWLMSYALMTTLSLSAAQPTFAAETEVPATQQQGTHTVKGKVVDDMGEVLPGVVIRVKGSKATAVTDMDGNFEIPVQKDGKVTLTATLVGMEDVETTVSTSKPANIQMAPSVKMMNEVIVTGFQSISRERSTGSATLTLRS